MLEKQIKINRLEKLCRALQAERNALIGKARTSQGKSFTNDIRYVALQRVLIVTL